MSRTRYIRFCSSWSWVSLASPWEQPITVVTSLSRHSKPTPAPLREKSVGRSGLPGRPLPTGAPFRAQSVSSTERLNSIRLLAEMVHPALCDTTCWCLSVLFAPALAGGLSTAVYGGLVFRFKFVGGESWRQQELLLMLLGVPGSLSSLHHGVFHRKRDRIPQ